MPNESIPTLSLLFPPSQIDPALKFEKMEDEVPLFFKRLKYPFQASLTPRCAALCPRDLGGSGRLRNPVPFFIRVHMRICPLGW